MANYHAFHYFTRERGWMIKCIDCGYQDFEFKAGIAGCCQGAFTYFARCPKCGSSKIKHLPGYYERDLRVRVVKRGGK